MSAAKSPPRFFSDGRAIWYIETIWAAANGLPSEEVSIDEVRDFDEVCWFGDAWGKRPTCRAVVEHCVRMNAADLSSPIILGPNGELLDGMHRVGKAVVEGSKTIRAIRLRRMPPPDEQVSPDDPRYQAGVARVMLDGLELTIEPMQLGDYDEVLALWQGHPEAVGLNESDTREGISAFLARNSDLSLVAKSSGKIVAAVLCGHDGRRGYLHHLAVAPSYGGKGIGTAMVERCISALANLGIPKCNVFVFGEASEAAAFWSHRGFSQRDELCVLQRVIHSV